MQPRIIAVRGVNNCGKTTAIKMAYETFLARATSVVPVNLRHKEVRGAVIEIDGVKVGWISLGDYEGILQEWIDYLLDEHDCEVVVCACRSYGGTANYLYGLENAGYAITWVRKARVEEASFRQANRRKAAELVKAIEAAVVAVNGELSATA
ncbi:hypothetical protein J0H58_13370 [bacterium]|nr:hypothetical protein [bacterium]